MRRRRGFSNESEDFRADTCEPLKRAAATGQVRLEALGRGSYPGQRLPDDDLPELRMAGWWDAHDAQDWGLGWHCNEGIEIGYLSAGRLPFAVGDHTLEVAPGGVTVTRPWQRHRVGEPAVPACHYSWLILDLGVRRPNQPWRWPDWVLLSPSVLDRLTDTLRHNEQPVWQADAELGRCFARLDRAVTTGTGEANRTRLKILINDLLLRLAEMLESSRPTLDRDLSGSERTVRLFLEALDDRLGEPWTLESMAAACGLARTRFATYCRKITNGTPVEHLTASRLRRAAELLATRPDLPVTEIAFRCGFQSSQYFARAFRRRYGHPPSRFRKPPPP
jgi:AraC family L-rhamnose operon regulatory protein RhaS